ncbi:lipid kinase YegS [Motilimonas pumila]|uniref:Lipid kinase YegS n=1 Tax=Motilimonas pumila TaxID=2303987 RepID=A0A418YB53_9GAMM|nr:lipid kinase YegS [Motilimonas pumila]RJG40208.1 lipid kinase YegS [Motilimonas pumila]
MRIIVNGKKAAEETFRQSVYQARQQGHEVEVRATWEGGDVERLVQEAHAQGYNHCSKTLMIAGGDGSVQEVVSALMALPESQRPSLGILPMGTANDFATACGISWLPEQAITLAIEGEGQAIDVVQATQQGHAAPSYFINAATAGFGAQVTAETPIELKNLLGGAAYTLTGAVQALNFKPYRGVLESGDNSSEIEFIVGALCNGRQAGGGKVLAPNAKINDGLLDFVYLKAFTALELPMVLEEARAIGAGELVSGDFIVRKQVHWLEFASHEQIPTNHDGEPQYSHRCRYQIVPGAIKLKLPPECPTI